MKTKPPILVIFFLLSLGCGTSPAISCGAAADGGPPPAPPEIRDIHLLPETFPGAAGCLLALAGLALVAGGVAHGLLRRGDKARRQTPYERAAEALARLSAEAWPAGGASGGPFDELSIIIKCYIEAAFAVQASALTTEELAARIGAAGGFSTGGWRELCDCLALCDEVKFAGRRPSREAFAAAAAAARAALARLEGRSP